MPEDNTSLTSAEWNVMECLWASSPRTGRGAIDYLKKNVGWARSTTLTMLRRMTEKGFIRCQEEDGVKVYSPLLKREDAVRKETEDFINRVYKGSISQLMSAITTRQELTEEEINELYSILKKAEEAQK